MSTDKENGHALYTTRTQDIQDSHGKECCTGDVVRGCCSWHATRKIKKKRNKKGISSDKERRMLA